jgi:hypothetical protein
LQAIDKIHLNIATLYNNLVSPRFDVEENNNKLIIHYKSNRNLIDSLISLVKGVGKYYNEKLEIKKVDNKTVEVIF